MGVVKVYKPYENWKAFKIIEENDKEFLEIYNYKLQIDETNYIPKAGLLFEEILKNRADGKRVLDLGCGQMGILGLIALHYGAKEILSVDVDERCTKWLSTIIQENGIKNISVLNSDMFSGINEKDKFDLILSNPPHMPMKERKIV